MIIFRSSVTVQPNIQEDGKIEASLLLHFLRSWTTVDKKWKQLNWGPNWIFLGAPE